MGLHTHPAFSGKVQNLLTPFVVMIHAIMIMIPIVMFSVVVAAVVRTASPVVAIINNATRQAAERECGQQAPKTDFKVCFHNFISYLRLAKTPIKFNGPSLQNIVGQFPPLGTAYANPSSCCGCAQLRPRLHFGIFCYGQGMCVYILFKIIGA